MMTGRFRSWAIAGIAGVMAAAAGYSGCRPRNPEYGVVLVNNTGDTVYKIGVDFGPGPLTLADQLGDGAWMSYNRFPCPLPDRATVFWEQPNGVRHEQVVAVRPAVMALADRPYVKAYLAVRADGGVDVTALDLDEQEAIRYRDVKAVLRRGRPADKPEPPKPE